MLPRECHEFTCECKRQGLAVLANPAGICSTRQSVLTMSHVICVAMPTRAPVVYKKIISGCRCLARCLSSSLNCGGSTNPVLTFPSLSIGKYGATETSPSLRAMFILSMVLGNLAARMATRRPHFRFLYLGTSSGMQCCGTRQERSPDWG